MQSLKALHLVEGVPGPKGGYKAIAAAYERSPCDADDNVVDVPVIRNGSPRRWRNSERDNVLTGNGGVRRSALLD